jgi:hypothetical protein
VDDVTRDELYDACFKMTSSCDGHPRAIDLGTPALCSELVRQGLAARSGPRISLTGSGWAFVRPHWPDWMKDAVTALAVAITLDESPGAAVLMVDIAKRAELEPTAERTVMAWSVILHMGLQFFAQAGRPPDGSVWLNARAYDSAEWTAALAAEPWELLPIPEAT